MPSATISTKTTQEFKDDVLEMQRDGETKSDTYRRLIEEGMESEQTTRGATREVLKLTASISVQFAILFLGLTFANIRILGPNGSFIMLAWIVFFSAFGIAIAGILTTDAPERFNEFLRIHTTRLIDRIRP